MFKELLKYREVVDMILTSSFLLNFFKPSKKSSD